MKISMVLNPHCRDFLLNKKVLRKDIQDETESNLWYYLRRMLLKYVDRENKLHDFNFEHKFKS